MFGYKVIEHEAHSVFRFVCTPQVIWREQSLKGPDYPAAKLEAEMAA